MTDLNRSFQGFHHLTWSQAIAQLENEGTDYVIATVLTTSGSTPRVSGTKMVITGENIYATLGGGHLEFKVIEKARELLSTGQTNQTFEQFQLAANLGQCCGGAVVILFETMISQSMLLDVYGAGHVAQALIPILAQLPIKIRWIDSRSDVFPQQIPDNVQKIVDEEPAQQALLAKANSVFLILTHNHQLDFDLTETIIKRGDALWLGVIGSETKAKRFRHRLKHKEFNQLQIDTMICPVGLEQVSGKLPMEVAVAISGQLIALYQSNKAHQQPTENIQWRTLKDVLTNTNQQPEQTSDLEQGEK